MKKIVTLSMLLALAVSISASAMTSPYPTNTLTTTINNTATGAGSLLITTSGQTKEQDRRTSITTLVRDGSAVTITAKPTAGSVFSGWGGYCSGDNNTCTINNMNNNKTVVARFSLKQSGVSQREFVAASSSCAKTAVEKRDAAVIAALNKYTADWIAVIMARTEKQKLAFDKSGADRVALMRASRESGKAGKAIISKTMNASKTNANKVYRLELKICGIGSEGLLDD